MRILTKTDCDDTYNILELNKMKTFNLQNIPKLIG